MAAPAEFNKDNDGAAETDGADWIVSDPLGWEVYDYHAMLAASTEVGSHIATGTHIIEPARRPTHHTHHLDPLTPKNDMLMTQATNAALPAMPAAPATAPLADPNAMPTTPTVTMVFDGDTSRANPHFKPLLPAPKHRGAAGRQLIMDTETTGLDAAKGDRIVEVGIIEMVNRKVTGEKLHVYINPQRPMHEDAVRIHGISEAFLADKPTFAQVAQPLYQFMLGAEVIAHNASFDMSFLTMEFANVGLTDFAQQVQVTDSLAMAKQQYPGQKNSLDALVRRLNVGKMERTFHGALLDAEILAEVYLAMTGGQVSLAIDDDSQSQEGGSHKEFAHLAATLVVAPSYASEHLHWVAQQLSQYPQVAQTQGVTCFYQTASPNHPGVHNSPLLVSNRATPATTAQTLRSAANLLMLAS